MNWFPNPHKIHFFITGGRGGDGGESALKATEQNYWSPQYLGFGTPNFNRNKWGREHWDTE